MCEGAGGIHIAYASHAAHIDCHILDAALGVNGTVAACHVIMEPWL